MEENDVVVALSALAQPVRLKVFRALVVAGRSGLTAGTIADGVGVPATSLSFHLKEMMHSGLVSQQRDGRYLIYRADFEQMNGLLGFLTANCCQDAACLAETSTVCDC